MLIHWVVLLFICSYDVFYFLVYLFTCLQDPNPFLSSTIEADALLRSPVPPAASKDQGRLGSSARVLPPLAFPGELVPFDEALRDVNTGRALTNQDGADIVTRHGAQLLEVKAAERRGTHASKLCPKQKEAVILDIKFSVLDSLKVKKWLLHSLDNEPYTKKASDLFQDVSFVFQSWRDKWRLRICLWRGSSGQLNLTCPSPWVHTYSVQTLIFADNVGDNVWSVFSITFSEHDFLRGSSAPDSFQCVRILWLKRRDADPCMSACTAQLGLMRCGGDIKGICSVWDVSAMSLLTLNFSHCWGPDHRFRSYCLNSIV